MPDNPYSMSNNTSDATAFVPQSSSEGPEKRDQEKGSKKKFSSYQTTESNVVDNLHQDDQPTPEYDSSSLFLQQQQQQQQQLDNDIFYSQPGNFPDNNIQQILQNVEYTKHANSLTPTTYKHHHASLLSSPFLDDLINNPVNYSDCGCCSLDDGIPKNNTENVYNGNVSVSFTPQSLSRPQHSALSNRLNFTSPRRGFLTPFIRTATDAFGLDDTNPKVSLSDVFGGVGGVGGVGDQLSAPSGDIDIDDDCRATGLSFPSVKLGGVDVPPILEVYDDDDDALAAAASVDFDIDGHSLRRSIDYTHKPSDNNEQIYKLNKKLIENIKQMKQIGISILQELKIKEDEKAETDRIIYEELEWYSKQPDSLNKTNQMQYLRECATFQKGKIDGIESFGLPILAIQCLCSTPRIKGHVDASNGGSALFGFEDCKSIKALQYLIGTFSSMGLCQTGKVKASDRLEVFIKNVRKCELEGEEAEGHFKCRCVKPREQRVHGLLLRCYLRAATKLGCQTIVLEVGGTGTNSFGVVEHAGFENISLLFAKGYHVQFLENLYTNLSNTNSRALIQMLNMSDLVGEFSALIGREQIKTFVELFLSISLPDKDFDSLLARAILFKASKLKNPKQSGKKRKRKEVDDIPLKQCALCSIPKKERCFGVEEWNKEEGQVCEVCDKKLNTASLRLETKERKDEERLYNAILRWEAFERKAKEKRKQEASLPEAYAPRFYSYFEYSIGGDNDDRKVFYQGTISAIDAANAFSELDFTVSCTTIRNKAGKDGSEPSLLGGLITVKEVIDCIPDYECGFVGSNKEEVEASKDMIRNNLAALEKKEKKEKKFDRQTEAWWKDKQAKEEKQKRINDSFGPIDRSAVEDVLKALEKEEAELKAKLKENASHAYQKYVEIGSDINRLGKAELEALVKYVCKIENKDTPSQHCRTMKKMKERLGKCVPSWTSHFT